MNRFTELCSLLSQVTGYEYKEILLKEYLDSTPDKDILWALFLLSGRKLKKCFNLAQLWEILPELTGLPDWLIEESFQVSGDKAETVSLLLDGSISNSKFTLSQILALTDDLNDLHNSARLEKILNILNKLSSAEKFIFLKLITGSFHSHIHKNNIVNVLCGKYFISKLSAYHLLNNLDPYNNEIKDLLKYYKKNKDTFKLFPFSITEKIKIENGLLGDCKDWQAEWIWDGIRTQLIYRKGELLIWSKQYELITEKFPELYDFTKNLPDGTVIEGEIIAFSNGKPLPYNVLQNRLKKNILSNAFLKDFPAAFIVYDLLEFDGSDIRSRSLKDRRKLLERIFEKDNLQNVFYLSPVLEFKTWKTLKELKNSAAENNCKGIILKKKNSVYSGENWLSLNIEPYTFNAVLLYAQRSLNSDMYSELTFGAWFNEELITFTKTSGGLNDNELNEVTAFIKANTIEKFGPVRTVKPELVFEIHFEGISVSKRHKSGITLRNPKIHCWHKDRKPHEAGHLKNLLELLNASK